MNFKYTCSNLTNDFETAQSSSLNTFDYCLRRRWSELRATKDIFRYELNIKDERILPGRFGFVLQLNPERATQRRAPQEISSMKQPFVHDKFNFNKISEKEILFCISRKEKDFTRNIILVNDSPITEYHSLICPNVDLSLPQVITLDSLLLIADIMFLCHDRNLHVLFNSLCAMASVNHLHYHIVELKHRLYLEDMKCPKLKRCVHTTDPTYPARAFCFQIKTASEIVDVCRIMFHLCTFLSEREIAHNLFATRGRSFEEPAQFAVRFFIFPRLNYVGTKDVDFNLGAFEFAGYFPMKDYASYQSRTESDIIKIFKKNTKFPFMNVVEDVKKLINIWYNMNQTEV